MNKCKDCLWFSNNHMRHEPDYCMMYEKKVNEYDSCSNFRHIDTAG